MPRPVYIICSESGAIDEATNLVSHFSVLEQITFRRRPDEEKLADRPLALFRCRVVAVWMKTDDDVIDRDYESQVVLVDPPEGKETIVGEQRFRFAADKRLQRFIADLVGHFPAEGSGTLWIKHRIRMVGHAEWMTQEFPIVIIEETADEGTADEDAADKDIGRNGINQLSNEDR